MKDKKEPAWLKFAFFTAFLFLIICFIVSWIQKASYRIDSTVHGLFLIWLFFKRKKLGIEPWVLVGVMIPLLMDNAGLFGAYNLSWGVVGYDKWLHLVSGFVFTFALYQWLASKKFGKGWKVYLVAFLMFTGLGAIEELAEFIGSVYLGVSQGFLAQAAGEAFYKVSDLVRFDSHWDMMFNFFGGLLTGIIIWIRK
ncbi:MAG: hypothetical protein AABX70_06665 [Nanoarchaeota archaeon]